jgi:long-chain acyl-CoA synthetase
MSRYFWQGLAEFGDRPALLDEQNGTLSYRQLSEQVERAADALRGSKRKLVFLAAENDIGGIFCYLGALAADLPIFVGRGGAFGASLLDRYRPDVILWKGAGNLPPRYRQGGSLFGYNCAHLSTEESLIGQDLALLLSMSGSLQSPKVARLSRRNIGIAATQVAHALQIDPDDRAVTSLPFGFVYGLSIINSHLHAGASIVVTRRSVQDPAFWRLMSEAAATSLAGVPWTYKGLQGIGFNPSNYPNLRKFALSGGVVDAGTRDWILTMVRQHDLRFYSMYGQTEAAGRMCVLPPELFLDKPASVGFPVQGGAVHCDSVGNILYEGHNVMLGYAHGRDSLDDLDQMGGILPTGDTGYLDETGCLYVTGRTARIAKMFGLRLDLDEIEALFSSVQPVAAACQNDHLSIYLDARPEPKFANVLKELIAGLRLPPHHVHLHHVQELPRTDTGKISYGSLAQLALRSE